MHNQAMHLIFVALIISPLPVLAFIDIETMPYSLLDEEGATIYWNESYRVTVDDMLVQIVLGQAEISGYGDDVRTINWDPEIVSVIIEGDELMRRTGFQETIVDDPMARMPFLGIGGIVSPTNLLRGLMPLGAPSSSFTWIDRGEDGLVAWRTSYEYAAGDVISWLNRTFLLNASLNVECEFQMTSEYQAVGQRVTVTNGDAAQLLPFPLESSFSLGNKLSERGISLPNMTLDPDRCYVYPESQPPSDWYNKSLDSFLLPPQMWEEKDLPGMLYLEFDLPSDRNWYGMSTVTDLAFELQSGVGVKVLSTSGMEGFRPYCIFVSGPGDHVILGFKPFQKAGPYDEFLPLRLGPGESVSIDLVWFFPEPSQGGMSIPILEEFARKALSVGEFHGRRIEAEDLFRQANDFAAEGRMEEALAKADMSIAIYNELGAISSALLEEGRTINATKYLWITASADVTPHPDRAGRPAILYSTVTVIVVIVALASWIYVIRPHRASVEE